MIHTILIIAAGLADLETLKAILGKDYAYKRVECGEEALEVLQSGYGSISAVVLDASAAEPDGLALLKRLRGNRLWAQIPVFAALDAGQEELGEAALSLGANVCLERPYRPGPLRALLSNTLRLCEAAGAENMIRQDKLTGLFSRDTFFEEAGKMIRCHEAGYYVLDCFNIDNFKVVNDQYGMEKGDLVLRHVGECFRSCMEPLDGICCRYMADRFAVLYPVRYLNLPRVLQCHRDAETPACIGRPIRIRIGRCIVDDVTLPVGSLFDRAAMAEDSIKGRYDLFVREYQESMRAQLLAEQRIVSEMNDALRSGAFEPWFQPQYNHATGALIGAEALVRWRHAGDGRLIPPCEFIPAFERNGFIYELDKYIWEQVCILLRRWRREGRNPLPISVNISRFDVLAPDFIDVLTALLRRYEVPAELLRLEITESAFSQTPELIVTGIKKLIELGFTVEIDDFGSGYSSLNTLKDVPAHILKLDMKFLEGAEDSNRGGHILESVVRMAKWLGMSVIAEGVETREQADYLKSIGCFYVQGYLYARPMPISEYEALGADAKQVQRRLEAPGSVTSLSPNSFWDAGSMDTLIFNRYLGGACILEVFGGRIEVLRVNDKYMQVIGSAGMTMADALKPDWACHMDADSRNRFFAALQAAARTGEEQAGEYLFYRLPGCGDKTCLRVTLRAIAISRDRILVYCMVENTTALRRAEEKALEAEGRCRIAAEQLQMILDSVGSSVTASVMEGGVSRLLFANRQFYRMTGLTREQYRPGSKCTCGFIHPEDRDWVRAVVHAVNETRRPLNLSCRVLRGDNTVSWIESNLSMISIPGIEAPVQLGIANEVAEQRLAR